jgi:hypothetical protein
MSRTRITLLATAAALTAGLATGLPAWAEKGGCSQPLSSGVDPVASDCLFILRAAVGTTTCSNPCICQPRGVAPTKASDALRCLQFSVGQNVAIDCPCGSPDVESSALTFDPELDLTNPDIESRFVKTRYRGAFSQDATAADGDWTADWTVFVHGNNKVWHPATEGTLNGATPAADGSCPTGTTDIGNTNLPAPFTGTMDICELAGRYSTDGQTITLTNDNVYRLNQAGLGGTLFGNGDAALSVPTAEPGYVEAVNTHLVVEAGTLILGGTAEALVITRGSDIDMNGTADNPIVMDSQVSFDAWVGGNDAGGGRGDWSGLVLTGFGVINRCTDSTSCDFLAEGLEATIRAGGQDDAWSCGDIDYLVIDNPGYDIDGTGNDTNGLTVYGCEYPTGLDFIQVNNSLDDAFEFFGGSAVITHAVATKNQDDNFDTDFGYTGGAQFGLVIQATDRGDKAFELDNGRNTDTVYQTAIPLSTPNFANITVLNKITSNASDNSIGVGLRTWTNVNMWNVIQTGAEANGLRSEESTGTNRGVNGSDGLNFVNSWFYNPNAVAETTTNGVIRGTDATDKTNLTATLSAPGTNNIVDRTSNPGLSATGYPDQTP